MWRQATLCSIVILICGGSLAACRSASKNKPDQEIAAAFGETRITMKQLEERVGNRLVSVKNQEYAIKESVLREMAAELLVEQEAARRGLSSKRLIEQEVDAKATPPTEIEIGAYYERVRERVKDRPKDEVLQEIAQGLGQQKRSERHAAFTRELAVREGLRLFIEPPRAVIGSVSAPTRGSADAPVTIVTFSNFQCPWCSRAALTLHEIERHYGDKLRVIYRHYPYRPEAQKAAEAASCADEQGKFWEMHDKLFATQTDLAVPKLKEQAVEVGLNAKSFEECLDSNRRAKDWQRDLADGERLGITGTPAFFINGRLLSGAQPLARFQEVVDDELARLEASATEH
ncbi:MAG: thioredoxin domain-containing protein [Vicinamibacteria bacterium]|nr:thioredoxin domain-containing protein [Vicinamibacteria bacterium]